MQPIQVQGYLLALCRNNMQQYTKVCEMLLDSLIVDSNYSRSVNGEAVLNLANSLKPFDKRLNDDKSIEVNNFDRNKAHLLCKKNANLPEVVDWIFGKPGVSEKRSV